MAENKIEAEKINAAMSVTEKGSPVMKPSHYSDISFIKALLPASYSVTENKAGAIRCVSGKGILKSPYPNPSTGNIITDAEDDEHWEYIVKAIQQRFKKRFQEIYHNTCFAHKDFVVYLKQQPL